LKHKPLRLQKLWLPLLYRKYYPSPNCQAWTSRLREDLGVKVAGKSDAVGAMAFSKCCAWGLFLFSFGTFLLTASGRDSSTDGAQSFSTVQSFVLHGTIRIENDPDIGAIRANDGHYYSKYAPALAIAEVPFFVGLHALATALKLEDKTAAQLLRAWVPALLNIALTGATLVLIYAVVLKLGYSSAIALIVSLLTGFTSPIWVYAKTDFSEPLQSLLLLATFLALIRTKAPLIACASFWIGLILALLLLTKALYIVLIPIIFLALLWKLHATSIKVLLIVLVSFGLPVLAGALLHLAWNYARFGSLFDFGYSEPFDTPLLVGLYGWFFSSGKSMFLYAPLLLLLIWAIPHFARRHPFESVVIATMTLPVVVIYSTYWSWHGDWAWALRYGVPLLPLWMLPIATSLAFGKTWRWAISTLAPVGLFVQILGLAIDSGTYLNIHAYQLTPIVHPGQGSDMIQSGMDVHFIPEFSPLAGHWWLLKATLEWMRSPQKDPSEYVSLHSYPWAGREERANWKPPNPEYGLGLNFWWLRNPSYMNTVRTNILMSLSLALAAIGFALMITGLRAGLGQSMKPHPVPA
jgi:hypothetical protein